MRGTIAQSTLIRYAMSFPSNMKVQDMGTMPKLKLLTRCPPYYTLHIHSIKTLKRRAKGCLTAFRSELRYLTSRRSPFYPRVLRGSPVGVMPLMLATNN
eukprot:4938257-Pyramimonas_sp.AAC.1